MFELFLNAARFAASSEARAALAEMFDAVRRSPEWQKEIVVVDSRIRGDESARLELIRQMVLSRMTTDGYTEDACSAVSIAFIELTRNALEHGRRRVFRTVVRSVVEITSVYVSVTVYNPNGRSANVAEWIKKAERHLIETERAGRGRGLIMAYKRVDELCQFEKSGVRAIVYRDRVALSDHKVRGTHIVVIASGHNNPSIGRRLYDYLHDLDCQRVVICEDYAGLGVALDAITMEAVQSREAMSDPDMDPSASWFYREVVSVAQRLKGDRRIRLVCASKDVRLLLPPDLVCQSIEEALARLEL